MAGVDRARVGIEALYMLPEASLRAIASSLRGGQLSVGITAPGLQPIVGGASATVLATLLDLSSQGLDAAQVALLLEALAGQQARVRDATPLYDIVLSGPDVPSVPSADTGAVMQTLIADARDSIMLVGYAVHNGKRLFAPLVRRMETSPHLRVVMCLDISRAHTDSSLSSEIVARFAADFRSKHWPWPQVPTVLYDPRALSEDREERASLHAKCIIVDRKAALVTSANFTEAAHQRNIEAGILVRDEPLVARLAAYFGGLRASGKLIECPLSVP